jgi:hypothetical protein
VIDLTGSDSDDAYKPPPPPMSVDEEKEDETLCPYHAQNLKTVEVFFEFTPDLAASLRPHPSRYAEGTCHCADCFPPAPAIRSGVGRSFVNHEWVHPAANVSRFEVNSEGRHDSIDFAEQIWCHETGKYQTGHSSRGGMNNGVMTVYHGCGDPVAVSSIVTGGFVLPGGVGSDGTKVRSRNCAGRQASEVFTTPTPEYALQKIYSLVGPAPPAPDGTPMSACLVIEAEQIIGSYSVGAATLAHSNGRAYGLAARAAVEFRSERPDLIIPVAILVRTFPTDADPLVTRYNHGF